MNKTSHHTGACDRGDAHISDKQAEVARMKTSHTPPQRPRWLLNATRAVIWRREPRDGHDVEDKQHRDKDKPEMRDHLDRAVVRHRLSVRVYITLAAARLPRLRIDYTRQRQRRRATAL